MKRAIIFFFVSTIAAVAVMAQAPEPVRIDRLDPALDSIVPPNARMDVDATPPGANEGPVWIRKGGYLLYTNMTTRAINKLTPSDGKVITLLEHTDSNGVTLDRQGRVVWMAHPESMDSAPAGTVVRLEKDGTRTVLASEYEGKPLNAPNDLVYKSNGTLYFTDPGRVQRHTGQPTVYPDSPRVYMLKEGGKLRSLALPAELRRPNGIAFSPGEKYLYINSTAEMTIWRFDMQPDGTISNGRIFINEDPDKTAAPGSGSPDGMKVDHKGDVYCTGPGGVWIISPEGKQVGTILAPATNLTFGGPDGKTLFIASRLGIVRVRVKIPGIRPS
jgi:gluconolactonase